MFLMLNDAECGTRIRSTSIWKRTTGTMKLNVLIRNQGVDRGCMGAWLHVPVVIGKILLSHVFIVLISVFSCFVFIIVFFFVESTSIFWGLRSRPPPGSVHGPHWGFPSPDSFLPPPLANSWLPLYETHHQDSV